MATRTLARSVLTAKQTLSYSHSYPSFSFAAPPSSLSFASTSSLRRGSLVTDAEHLHRLSGALNTLRTFATRQTASSLNDPNPNWSNRPPKETILLDGCDFEHWLVVMEPPEGEPTRDEIIDSYIKTLAMVVGSEEEARMKIYSVSTRHYYAFGALVSEELSYKIKELPKVRWVLPDSYLNVKTKDYGGEPFINGQAVPYDPKYHEEWVRNNARANERNRRNRNDRPRSFDRSRNFERRRENVQNQDFQAVNRGGQNIGTHMEGMAPDNMGGQPNMGGMPQNLRQTPPNSMGGMPRNNMGPRPASHKGQTPPNNMGRVPTNTVGGGRNMGRLGNNPNSQYGGGSPADGGMPSQNRGNQPSYDPNSSSGNPY